MIEIINATKIYDDNGAKGFQDLSLKIDKGEFVFETQFDRFGRNNGAESGKVSGLIRTQI